MPTVTDESGVLPPPATEAGQARPRRDSTLGVDAADLARLRRLTRVLDDAFQIPGTTMRVSFELVLG